MNKPRKTLKEQLLHSKIVDLILSKWSSKGLINTSKNVLREIIWFAATRCFLFLIYRFNISELNAITVKSRPYHIVLNLVLQNFFVPVKASVITTVSFLPQFLSRSIRSKDAQGLFAFLKPRQNLTSWAWPLSLSLLTLQASSTPENNTYQRRINTADS